MDSGLEEFASFFSLKKKNQKQVVPDKIIQ